MAKSAYTKIGCEIIIRDGDKILFGLRKNCFGAGEWGLPSGHLEFRERAIDTAVREVLDETGAKLEPEKLTLVAVDDTPIKNDAEHHLQIAFEYLGKIDPKLVEPDLCDEWRWFAMNDLPKKIFSGHRQIIKNYATNTLYKVEEEK
jgi:8-oxo-dGTP diphosphatase